MSLRFYNTLTRSLQPFEPLVPGTARVYACGPTVYQLPHIGNYRTFLFNDVLRRYLTWKGYQVRFVMNLTDVDDKVIEAADAGGRSITEHTRPFG
jgi:cysteinyl-tRNA synthetase